MSTRTVRVTRTWLVKVPGELGSSLDHNHSLMDFPNDRKCPGCQIDKQVGYHLNLANQATIQLDELRQIRNRHSEDSCLDFPCSPC